MDAVAGLKREFGDAFLGLLLFGSHARWEENQRSDVDVLVVFRGLHGLKVRSKAYEILAEHIRKPLTLVDIDILDFDREDLEVTPLLLNVLYDGIIVYDEAGILGELKKKVLKLIKKARLKRYRTPDGKYGWVREDGKPIEPVEA